MASANDRSDLDMSYQREAVAKEARMRREMFHRFEKEQATKLMNRNFNRHAAHMLLSEAAHYQHRRQGTYLTEKQRRDRSWFASVHEDIELLFDERRQQDDPTASIRQDFSNFLLFPSASYSSFLGETLEVISR